MNARRPRPCRSKREPTIALINIVFLMLVFFMVSGTLAPSLDPDMRLVDTRDMQGHAPADALVMHRDGRMSYRGATIADASAFWAQIAPEDRDVVRIVPDRDLPAVALVRLGRHLRDAGAGRVVIVTQRALQ
ncbi:MAG: biopolymer transporter ExbD [Pseudomonadota bacterium]